MGKRKFFPEWFAAASVTIDSTGQPWLVAQDGEGLRVGLGATNLLDADSNPKFAVQLMLGRVAYALSAKNHYREAMPQFQQDWALLLQAIERFRATPSFSIASKDSVSAAPAVAAAPVQ